MAPICHGAANHGQCIITRIIYFIPKRTEHCARTKHRRDIGSTPKTAPSRPAPPGASSPGVWARVPHPALPAPAPRGCPRRVCGGSLRGVVAEKGTRTKKAPRNARRCGTPPPGHPHLVCGRGRPTLRCPLPLRAAASGTAKRPPARSH